MTSRTVISCLWMTLGCFLIGCDRSSGTAGGYQRKLPESVELPNAPEIADFTIWRPLFTASGNRASSGEVSGSGFGVKPESHDETFLVTALHLVREASGLSSDLPAKRLFASIEFVSVSDAFGATDSISRIGNGLTLASEQQDRDLWSLDDVAVFQLGKKSRVKPLPFATANLTQGDRAWMVTAVFAGASASRKSHPVRISQVFPDGRLEYMFEDTDISLQATDGAPLVNDAGDIVGIHLSGDPDREGVHGRGLSGGRLKEIVQVLTAGQKELDSH